MFPTRDGVLYFRFDFLEENNDRKITNIVFIVWGFGSRFLQVNTRGRVFVWTCWYCIFDSSGSLPPKERGRARKPQTPGSTQKPAKGNALVKGRWLEDCQSSNNPPDLRLGVAVRSHFFDLLVNLANMPAQLSSTRKDFLALCLQS